jgi:hypothetical protein
MPLNFFIAPLKAKYEGVSVLVKLFMPSLIFPDESRSLSLSLAFAAIFKLG